MDLFLACIFICHVNYIKIKANNIAKKCLENNMTTNFSIRIFQKNDRLNLWLPGKTDVTKKKKYLKN